MFIESTPSGGILLLTKLYPPRLRTELTPRPRLIERLNTGINCKLTLISAGAGFGKSFLLGHWIAQNKYPVGWVTLDEQDNDPLRFWLYMLHALQHVQPHAGHIALELLPALPIIEPENLLTALINDIVLVEDDFFIVLDDYNVIHAESIHEQITFLLNHLPRHMHLVISSRTTPSLPLSRLRARGELVELRADDLRFTEPEAQQFLTETMHLRLSPDDMRAVFRHSEGWIVGLQMSALVANDQHGMEKVAQSADELSRHIIDYLAEEVLEQQKPEIQDFLLKTSILDRMCSALCNAITGITGSQEKLAELERANLFIIPLDEARNWYRYHVLFAEFLRDRVQRAYPDQLKELHLRASQWYEQSNDKPEAIRHAILAGDYERVAMLVEQIAAQMFVLGKSTMVRGWLGELPNEVVDSRVALDLVYTWTYILEGQLEIAAIHLRHIEQRLTDQIRDATTHSRAVYRNLLGEVHVLRALTARIQEDIPSAVSASKDALNMLNNRNPLLEMLVTINLGQSYWLTGDVASASRTFTEALAIEHSTRNPQMSWVAIHNLARLAAATGNLRRAMDMYRQAQDMLKEITELPANTGIVYAGMGELLYEWNDLETAEAYLAQELNFSSPVIYPDHLLSSCHYLAMVRQIRGDAAGAVAALEPAIQRVQQTRSSRMLAQLESIRAHLWLLQGDFDAVDQWVYTSGIHPNDKPNYQRESDYLILARILLAQKQPAPVISMIRGFVHLAESQGRMARVIAMQVTLSVAYALQGDMGAACDTMRGALLLAEPEGYIRTFVDAGQPAARILRMLESGLRLQKYIERVLAAFDYQGELSHAGGAVESLSEREREVLALIALGMSNKAIAEQLVLSVGTVKTHIKSIFRKLDVHSRTQAVRKGYDLGFLYE